jgi:hypothetical protein
LVTKWKTSQRNVNSGQTKKHNFIKRKCFPSDKERKTLSFLSLHPFSQITVSLSFQKQLEAGTIEAFLWNN